MSKEIAAEMVGKRFGRLTVIGEAPRYVTPKTGKLRRQWRCRCDCGGETVTMAKRLESGHTISCGCRLREVRTKHGHHGTSTYGIWDAMVQRCTNENSTKFYMYGGRGIKVCDRWLKFEHFLADMGERPDGKSIDRRDNDGHYEPSNCHWATRKEQQRNMRRNHVVQYTGRTMTMAEAIELAGISGRGRRNYVYSLVNGGLSIEDALRRMGG